MIAAQGPAREAQPGGPGQPRAGGGGDVTNDVYIVQLSDAPVLSYAGGIAGRAATGPSGSARNWTRTAATSPATRNTSMRVTTRPSARAGGRKLYSYRYSFNGFAARLSRAAQAEALKTSPGVVRVTKDELRTANTSSTPTFLGLDAPGGLWDRLGGPERRW